LWRESSLSWGAPAKQFFKKEMGNALKKLILLTCIFLTIAGCSKGKKGNCPFGGLFPLSGSTATFGLFFQAGHGACRCGCQSGGRHRGGSIALPVRAVYEDDEGQPEKAPMPARSSSAATRCAPSSARSASKKLARHRAHLPGIARPHGLVGLYKRESHRGRRTLFFARASLTRFRGK